MFSACKFEEDVRMAFDRCAADEAAGCLDRVRLSKSAALARASLNGASSRCAEAAVRSCSSRALMDSPLKLALSSKTAAF